MRAVPMPGSNLPAPLLHDHDERAVPMPDGNGVLLIPGALHFPGGIDPFLADLERALLAPLDPADTARGCFR